MKISHVLTAIALSAMVAPAAMAKGAIRTKPAQIKMHLAKKAGVKRVKGGAVKGARRGSKKNSTTQPPVQG